MLLYFLTEFEFGPNNIIYINRGEKGFIGQALGGKLSFNHYCIFRQNNPNSPHLIGRWMIVKDANLEVWKEEGYFWVWVGWFYPDSSLILSKRIPSRYPHRWAAEETFTILPSLLLFRAVFFIVSNKRLVKRKWPANCIRKQWLAH